VGDNFIFDLIEHLQLCNFFNTKDYAIPFPLAFAARKSVALYELAILGERK
jgi:hypothetical protein